MCAAVEKIITAAAAGSGHRPLLVVHDAKEGHLVYDLLIESEETLAMRPFPRPAVPPLGYRPLAVVSGGTAILGAPPPIVETGFLRDTAPPIMLPMGDDTVIRMDPFMQHGVHARFE